MQTYVDEGSDLLASEVRNARYHDSGNKLEHLKTIVDLGLEHPTVGAELRQHLEQIVGAGRPFGDLDLVLPHRPSGLPSTAP